MQSYLETRFQYSQLNIMSSRLTRLLKPRARPNPPPVLYGLTLPECEKIVESSLQSFIIYSLLLFIFDLIIFYAYSRNFNRCLYCSK